MVYSAASRKNITLTYMYQPFVCSLKHERIQKSPWGRGLLTMCCCFFLVCFFVFQRGPYGPTSGSKWNIPVRTSLEKQLDLGSNCFSRWVITGFLSKSIANCDSLWIHPSKGFSYIIIPVIHRGAGDNIP